MSLTPTNHWKLGLFVVSGILAGLFAVFWFGVQRLKREAVVVYAYFDEEVDGLTEGSPVKYRGVPIGQVTNIELASDRQFIEVESEIFLEALDQLGLTNPFDDKVPGVDDFISDDYEGLRVQLNTQLLTGQSFVQTVLVSPEAERRWPSPEVRRWASLPSMRSTFKGLEDALPDVLDNLRGTLSATRTSLRGFDQALVDAQLGRLSADAQDLMQSLRRRVDTLDEMPALTSVQRLAEDLRRPDGELKRALTAFEDLGRQVLAELDTAEIAATTASLRSMGGRVGTAASDLIVLIEDLRGAVDGLDATLARVRSLVAMLERDPGSLLHGRSGIVNPLKKDR